ncbi:AraC family transcriptional regulator [Paenibacillus soyae]|uniref:AraC family transcriptional regulator n=1 Tax=Paenibacillus soyae TaxID=2969249 RepID=A0A9X2SDH6_9BACL|nr:AraC family transcriptional regulator [Paenibacillus soyae]MCR2807893.1 AraC family transcriptional regulator [Paenibacillus soyae]
MKISYTSEPGLDISRMSIRLLSAELHTGSSGELVEQHLTIPGVFIALIGGGGELIRESGGVRLERDHIYACPPESTFGLAAGAGSDLSVVILRFQLRSDNRDPADLEAIRRLYSELDGLRLNPPGHLASFCRKMHEHLASGDRMRSWRAQLDMGELLYQLLNEGKKPARDGAKHDLDRARHYMREHYKEELSIERLASVAGFSPKYFVDVFKKTYGISALDELTQIRMNQAKKLMLRSDRLLRDIAHEVGYADEFYFSRKFKQVVGMPPTAYMKKRGRRVAAYGSTALIGYMLPLGIIPYAAPLHPKWCKYYGDRYGADIPVHMNAYRQNHYKEQNMALLEQAKPELIVTSGGLEEKERARLSAIAPLIELPGDERDWKTNLAALAEALGEQAEQQLWLRRFEEKAALVRQQVQSDSAAGGRGKKVAALKLLKGKLSLFVSSGLHDTLHVELGLELAAGEAGQEFNMPVTARQLAELDADLVLLLVCQESETLASWSALKESTEWMSLPFVRDNRLRLISSEPWREYSPVAISRILDECAELLTGNCP